MMSLFTNLLAILPYLSFISLFNAIPVDARMHNVRHGHSRFSGGDHKGASPAATNIKTYLAPAPHWVAYTFSDYSKTQALPTGSQLVGYNVFIMSFWLSTSGPAFKAAEFAKLSQSTRQWIINDYHAHNISFLVSAFGYGDNPTTNGENPVTVANNLAAFVKQYNLDGVDIDYEDFGAFFFDNGTEPINGKNVQITPPEQWLAEFTTALRTQLPVGEYIVTHAPVAPWFTTNSTRYPGGAYRTVQKQVGNLIDWYNVQFYNQGSDYTNCPSLLTRSLAHEFPNTSLFEINHLSGVPLQKLVIGKPAAIGDATNGFTNLTVMADCLLQAKKLGWNAGAMLWQYPDANGTAIKTLRSLSWPV